MWALIAVVLLCLGAAFLMGGGPEKITAATSIAWVATGPLYLLFGGPNFESFDQVNALFDAAYFAGLALIAVRANRVWPLAAAGLALIPILGHLAAALNLPGMTLAYWAMTEMPFAFILIILCTSSWIARRRAMNGPPIRDWRHSGASGRAQ